MFQTTNQQLSQGLMDASWQSPLGFFAPTGPLVGRPKIFPALLRVDKLVYLGIGHRIGAFKLRGKVGRS